MLCLTRTRDAVLRGKVVSIEGGPLLVFQTTTTAAISQRQQYPLHRPRATAGDEPN